MTIFDQLKRDEGLSLKPYVDTVGKITIGIGRNLTDVGISEAEANYLLGNDVSKVTSALRLQMPWVDNLDDARFGVLQNMAFNMGVDGLKGFPKMLSAMEAENWDAAATEMVNSTWYRQVGPRAQRLVKQIETGEWV